MIKNRAAVISASFLLLIAAFAVDRLGYDQRIWEQLYLRPTPKLINVMKVFTIYGSWWVLIPAAMLGIWFAYSHLRGELGLRMGIAAAASAGLVELLKHILMRTRPTALHQLVSTNGTSFPSGHAQDSVVVYGMLGLIVLASAPQFRNWTIILFLLPLFIGWSRVFLGVHWPSDVLGGWGIGLLIVGIASASKRPRKSEAAAP